MPPPGAAACYDGSAQAADIGKAAARAPDVAQAAPARHSAASTHNFANGVAVHTSAHPISMVPVAHQPVHIGRSTMLAEQLVPEAEQAAMSDRASTQEHKAAVRRFKHCWRQLQAQDIREMSYADAHAALTAAVDTSSHKRCHACIAAALTARVVQTMEVSSMTVARLVSRLSAWHHYQPHNSVIDAMDPHDMDHLLRALALTAPLMDAEYTLWLNKPLAIAHACAAAGADPQAVHVLTCALCDSAVAALQRARCGAADMSWVASALERLDGASEARLTVALNTAIVRRVGEFESLGVARLACGLADRRVALTHGAQHALAAACKCAAKNCGAAPRQKQKVLPVINLLRLVAYAGPGPLQECHVLSAVAAAAQAALDRMNAQELALVKHMCGQLPEAVPVVALLQAFDIEQTRRLCPTMQPANGCKGPQGAPPLDDAVATNAAVHEPGGQVQSDRVHANGAAVAATRAVEDCKDGESGTEATVCGIELAEGGANALQCSTQ